MESQHVECPWCGVKVESAVQYCPECKNEIIKFETKKDNVLEAKAIGGWLLIYIISYCIAIGIILKSYYSIIRIGILNVVWTKYVTFATGYSILHLFCLIMAIAGIASKKKFVPKWIIGFEIMNLIALVVMFFLRDGIPQFSFIFGISLRGIWTCLWICYFLSSLRVKQTFVR